MQNFKVSGMTCDHCVRAVTQAIQRLDPAASVDVDLAAGRVAVRGAKADPADLAAAIAEEGYRVEPVTSS